jgi:hypothetical protein
MLSSSQNYVVLQPSNLCLKARWGHRAQLFRSNSVGELWAEVLDHSAFPPWRWRKPLWIEKYEEAMFRKWRSSLIGVLVVLNLNFTIDWHNIIRLLPPQHTHKSAQFFPFVESSHHHEQPPIIKNATKPPWPRDWAHWHRREGWTSSAKGQKRILRGHETQKLRFFINGRPWHYGGD